jgi:predicted flap endonuclease-1-like 5' DNA nuclease
MGYAQIEWPLALPAWMPEGGVDDSWMQAWSATPWATAPLAAWAPWFVWASAGQALAYRALSAWWSGGGTAGSVAAAPASGPGRTSLALVPSRQPSSSSADDLTRIEGIGPKIAKLLAAAGITTFEGLAAASPKKLAAVLADAGPRFRLARTETWGEQARLLAVGDEAGFERLAAELKGGVRG